MRVFGRSAEDALPVWKQYHCVIGAGSLSAVNRTKFLPAPDEVVGFASIKGFFAYGGGLRRRA